MGTVLLTILRILGYVLLGILALVLLVLLLVLFSSIWYRVDAEKDGDRIEARINAHYLLRIIRVKATYLDDEFKYDVFLFKKRIISSEFGKEEAEKEIPVQTADTSSVKETVETTVKVETAESASEEYVPTQTVSQDEIDKSVADAVREAVNVGEANDRKTADTDSKDCKDGEKAPKEKSRFAKLLDKVKRAYELITEPETTEYVRMALHEVGYLLKKLLPRHIEGRVEFGTGDPARTGQILGYIAIFYGLYANTLEINPDFMEKKLNGNVRIKGHLMILTLVHVLIRIVLNKRLKYLKSEFEKLA